MEAVFYLVHSLGSDDFERRDRDAAANVAAACERAGVKQIVYLGGLGDQAADASPHLRSRHETGRLLGSGYVPVTTVRAAMIVGKGSAAFETTVALVDRLPVMVMPRWVSTPTQPIAIDDISRYLAGVCGLEAAVGQSFDAGGPDVSTYRQIIERIAKLRRRRVALVEVPILSPRLSSLWLHLVTPVPASVARPLVEGRKNPTIAREERIPQARSPRPHAVRRDRPSNPRGRATRLLGQASPTAEPVKPTPASYHTFRGSVGSVGLEISPCAESF